ncbi:MAG: Tfp pilus assembly protein FimT/FimU [Lysobacter sp.]|nr:Tfp pilus assembly protein FimT/FimU [Lysobacter sp.]
MKSKRSAGFTLLELIVAVTVAAIMLAMAVPSLVSTINRNRLSGTANELVASLQYARLEAIKRNASVEVCRSADQNTCSSGSGPWAAWIVVVPDGDGNGTANDSRVLQSFQVKSPVEVRSAVGNGKFTYRPDGFARASDAPRGAFLNTSFDICIATRYPAQNLRRVRLVSGGRVATDSLDGNGRCS